MDKVADIEQAISAHRQWMAQLRQAVFDALSGIDVQTIRADSSLRIRQVAAWPRPFTR